MGSTMRFSIVVFCACMIGTANATVIASQDFEGNSVAVGIFADEDVGTAPGTIFDSGSGLGWVASFEDTNSLDGPLFGLEGNDLIGVVNQNSPTVINSSGFDVNDLKDADNITGNWFHVDDADGTVFLTFDMVDATSFSDLILEFDWTVAEMRPNDIKFDISINGQTVFDINGEDLTNDLPFVENFTRVTLDISQFDFDEFALVATFSNFVEPHDIGFDNLRISGRQVSEVPIPAGFILFSTAILGGFVVRIRQIIPFGR